MGRWFAATAELGDGLVSLHVEHPIHLFHPWDPRAAGYGVPTIWIDLWREGQDGALERHGRRRIAPGYDPRIVSDGVRAFGLFSGVPAASGGQAAPVAYDILADRLIEIQTPVGLPVGKNWQPFLRDGALYVVHELAPLRILQIDLENGVSRTVEETPFNLPISALHQPYSMFRGGSNPIVLENGAVAGVGHATIRRHRHAAFLWERHADGNVVFAFHSLFSKFADHGYNLVDPNSLFIDRAGRLVLGVTACPRDVGHEQPMECLLLRFGGEPRAGASLSQFLERRAHVGTTEEPNLAAATFFCEEMPCAIAHKDWDGCRWSAGEPGYLVYGPYAPITREGDYVAMLRYTTEGATGAVGEFDVTATGADGGAVLGATRIEAANDHFGYAQVALSTRGRVGMRLETRVRVGADVRLGAYDISLRQAGDEQR